MAMPEFNLLDEPWILASDNQGKPVTLSLTAVFEQAHELTALSGELPTQDVAILRLLLAVLHGTFPYKDENGEDVPRGGVLAFWQRIWLRGHFPMEAIRQYLWRYHERFWLFHPQRPFYQVADLDKGTSYKASKLVGEISESSNKPRLFLPRNGSAKNVLAYAEAARWLPYLIAFDDTSSKPTRGGEKMPSPGAGWLGRLGMIYAMGTNLFETLLLNFILTDDNDERWDIGGAVWEMENPRAAERVEIPIPHSQAALLTLQSRRVLLERREDVVTGFRLLGGDFFKKENAFVEQMTAWRDPNPKKSGDSYTPKRHEASRYLWRDFSSLVSKRGSTHVPGIVRWLSVLEGEGLLEMRQIRLRASVVKYGDKDFFVNDLFDDMLSVNATFLSGLGEEWVTRITQEIGIVEVIVKYLGNFARDLALASGEDAMKEDLGRRNAAQREAYFRLDMPFRSWLVAIDPKESDLDDACGAWRKEACNIILQLGKELIAEAGRTALVGREVEKDKQKVWITASNAYSTFLYRVLKKKREG